MPFNLYNWRASLPGWIEFNSLQSSAVGKAAELSVYVQDAANHMVFPLRQVFPTQGGNAASSKLVWKQSNHNDGWIPDWIGEKEKKRNR